jgi:hypothetical protein
VNDPNILLKEIEHNPLLRQCIGSAKGGHILPPTVVVVLGINIDEAVVDSSAGEAGVQRRGTLDFAELVSRAKRGGELGQQVINVSRATPGPEYGRVGQGRIEAIEVPPETAEAAWDDGPVIRRGLPTAMAENSGSIVVPEPEEVGNLIFFILSLPTMRVS